MPCDLVQYNMYDREHGRARYHKLTAVKSRHRMLFNLRESWMVEWFDSGYGIRRKGAVMCSSSHYLWPRSMVMSQLYLLSQGLVRP